MLYICCCCKCCVLSYSRKRASKWDTPAPSTGSATEAAREAARKLNAMLAAKGKLTTNAPAPLLVRYAHCIM